MVRVVTDLPNYTRDPRWRWTLLGLLLATLFAFHQPLRDMVYWWSTKADYSHGFFVAPFSLYLLWLRREKLPRMAEWPDWQGLVFIVLGLAMSMFGGITNKAKEPLQGAGLILSLAGVVVFCFSRYGLRWAWPGLVYLIFMVKMPDRFEMAFSFRLRQAASQASNFILQTLGYTSYVSGPQGTIITLNDKPLDVANACSGLSMVLTFAAVAVAFAMLVNRPLLDRVIIVLSALPIAVLSNILRITATALFFAAKKDEIGKAIMHDFAGWLMMPLALGFLWIELKVLDWLFTIPEPPERDNIVRMATQTAAAEWKMPTGGPQG